MRRRAFDNPKEYTLGVVGAGGFGREIMESLASSRFDLPNKSNFVWDAIYFVEDAPLHTDLNGIRILSKEDFLRETNAKTHFSICISQSNVRERMTKECLEIGINPVSIIHNAATIHESTKIGPGAVICNSAIITSNCIIGRSFHANFFTYVAHDCIIGDFVTLGPRVTVNGNVQIGDHAYIGAGAVIRQGQLGKKLVIGKHAIVGMGAIVTKDVPDRAVVVGNPARILRFND